MKGTRKRLYFLHRWTGLSLALLGILVFFSGALVTFHEELEAWATRGDRIAPLTQIANFNLDQTWFVAKQGVSAEYLHQVDITRHPHGPLSFFMHKHVTNNGQVSEFGVYRVVDPRTGKLLVSRTGPRATVTTPLPRSALAHFFVQLHTVLLLPRTLGLIATGLVGFGLTLLIGTGTLVHRPTWSKLVAIPRTHRLRLWFGDLHRQLGSWTLPYTAILALTGTFFSLATTVLIPVLALVAFNGDQSALIQVLVGKSEVSQSSAVASLDPMLRDASSRTDNGNLRFLFLEHWGEQDASAVFFMRKPNALGDLDLNHVYDGHSGEFLHTKPRLGTTASLGGSLFKLMGDLHYGTLLGTLTKVLWSLCGLATCLIACSGLLVFIARSADTRHPGVSVVRWMTSTLAGGLPLATAAVALTWVFSCMLDAPDPTGSMTWVFLLALAFTGICGALLDVGTTVTLSWAGAALAFLALPFVGPLATGQDMVGAWTTPAIRSTVAVDIGFLTLALGFGLAAWLLRERAAQLSSSSAAERGTPHLPTRPKQDVGCK